MPRSAGYQGHFHESETISFDPLKRGLGQGDRDDSGAGLGLGLYIVREVARAHGGEVTVRSDNGETVFTVSLPRRN